MQAYRYTLTNADLYVSESTASTLLAQVPAYTKLQLIDEAADWCQVRYEDQEGFMLSSELSTVKYTWEDVILRSYPAAASNPITLVPAKTEIAVLGINGDWATVMYDDKRGYIFTDYLTDDGYPPMPYDLQYFYSDMTKFVNTNNVKSPTVNLITTDLEHKITYIFVKDTNGNWKLLYSWSCTIGAPSTPTIEGTFYVTGRKPYFGSDTYRVKYATRIRGGYYYHSILFNADGTEITDSRLGLALSRGCIRLAAPNARWIYDNVLDSTAIIIH